MNPLKIAERLALASGAAALLLLGLAYWWLSNLVHEIAGTFLFLLLARHVYINRGWFRNLRRGKYNTRRRIIVLLHAAIIANTLVLFATSLVISTTSARSRWTPRSQKARRCRFSTRRRHGSPRADCR